MTLAAAIRHMENRSAAARHEAAAHGLLGDDTAAGQSQAAADWFDQQINDLTTNA